MKLVDILARELKAWPAKAEYFTQTYTGHTVFYRRTEGHERFPDLMVLEASGFMRNLAEDLPVLVAREQWQAAVDALNYPKLDATQQWSGEGLPPVGTVCEWHPNVHGWVQVTILGHDGEDTWYRVSGEDHTQTCRNMAFFRPILTAEQIAAEERKAIRGWLLDQHTNGGLHGIADALHADGYRKQPK